MPWYTITDSFDADFGVDQWHGHNVFFREGDKVFRINGGGDEAMGSTWGYLDITPLGRQETWEDSPAGYPQNPPSKGGTARQLRCQTVADPRRLDILTDPVGAAGRGSQRPAAKPAGPRCHCSSDATSEDIASYVEA